MRDKPQAFVVDALAEPERPGNVDPVAKVFADIAAASNLIVEHDREGEPARNPSGAVIAAPSAPAIPSSRA